MDERAWHRLDADRLRARLAERTPRAVGPGDADRRAAVTMLLTPEPSAPEEIEALFAIRAEVEGDPWSGHVALPGGREEPDDTDLLETALRELREETGIPLRRESCVGRLDDLHPRAVHLPSIAVTPFVAWLPERPDVRENYELAGHVWIPVTELAADRRASYERPATGGSPARVFDSIEYAGVRVWGLTLAVVEDFLRRVGGRHGP